MRHRTVNWYLKLLLGILFIVIIAGYTYIQSNDFARGPILIIDRPENGASVEEPLVMVEGSALHISDIQLNGNSIFIDETGHFSEQMLLVRGQNVITLSAQDKFGREVKKTLELVYK